MSDYLEKLRSISMGSVPGGTRGGHYSAMRASPDASEEERLINRIETGSCLSSDFQTIMDHSDGSIKKRLLQKENEALKNKAHLERLHGKGSFDNYDSNGNPMKHYTLDNVL